MHAAERRNAATAHVLAERGGGWHDRRAYARALKLYRRARRLAPSCPVIRYGVANALHMLCRHDEACGILAGMLELPDRVLLAGCPRQGRRGVQSLRLDVHYLLFHATIYATGSWVSAAPHLHAHLRMRRRGLSSLWSRRAVLREAERLRRRHAPGARSVTTWKLVPGPQPARVTRPLRGRKLRSAHRM